MVSCNAQPQNNGADHELSYYNTGVTTIRNGVFPPKNYTMDDVHCNGDENSLFECTYNKKHNCGRRERAGVNCISKCNIKLSTFITRCFVLQPKMILAFVLERYRGSKNRRCYSVALQGRLEIRM